ncbi:hypothetical protein ACIRCZ_11340 [Leifsonia sp. NPDC102414]|uniref:hypothetical protein n=1 Tax=Leifsonia sp. NPDC102414 TaxID=3364124 RepID=UPI0037F20A2B
MTKRDKKDPGVTTDSRSKLQPSRKDRFLPTELLGISAALAVFVGLIVLIATGEFLLAGVSFGIAFIVALVLMALFALAFKPNAAEVHDLEEQNGESPTDKPSGH